MRTRMERKKDRSEDELVKFVSSHREETKKAICGSAVGKLASFCGTRRGRRERAIGGKTGEINPVLD